MLLYQMKEQEMKIVEIDPRDDVIEYAIGDVHGYLDHMAVALDYCAHDAAAAGKKGRAHLLGDYVDRGPNSAGVLNYLINEPCPDHMEWLPICGNHDYVFYSTCKDDKFELSYEWWLHGGQQTLMSYGWDPIINGLPNSIGEWVPKEHLTFIEQLPMANKVGNLLFVHAGIQPGKPLEQQTLKDLMWIRGEFLTHKESHGVTVIHGHSPEKENPIYHGNRVAMDSGCFYTGEIAVARFDKNSAKPRLKTFSTLEATIHKQNNKNFKDETPTSKL